MQTQNVSSFIYIPNCKIVCAVGSRSGKINTEIVTIVISGWWVMLGFFSSLIMFYTEHIWLYNEKNESISFEKIKDEDKWVEHRIFGVVKLLNTIL